MLVVKVEAVAKQLQIQFQILLQKVSTSLIRYQLISFRKNAPISRPLCFRIKHILALCLLQRTPQGLQGWFHISNVDPKVGFYLINVNTRAASPPKQLVSCTIHVYSSTVCRRSECNHAQTREWAARNKGIPSYFLSSHNPQHGTNSCIFCMQKEEVQSEGSQLDWQNNRNTHSKRLVDNTNGCANRHLRNQPLCWRVSLIAQQRYQCEILLSGRIVVLGHDAKQSGLM